MTHGQTTKGMSLAKGPVGLIGLAMLVYGVTSLIFGGHGFAQHAPNGAIHGRSWLGLEANGWSGLLFLAGGLLLLLATPLHWAAKGMSLIVGLALGAAALVALTHDGRGAVGIFAANHLTELVWGGCAAVLIGLSQLPRVGAKPRADDLGNPAIAREAELPPSAGEPAHSEPARSTNLEDERDVEGWESSSATVGGPRTWRRQAPITSTSSTISATRKEQHD